MYVCTVRLLLMHRKPSQKRATQELRLLADAWLGMAAVWASKYLSMLFEPQQCPRNILRVKGLTTIGVDLPAIGSSGRSDNHCQGKCGESGTIRVPPRNDFSVTEDTFREMLTIITVRLY